MVGYEDGDGLFCPGGSFSNGTALNLARFHYFPDVKKNGTWNMPKLIVFASEEAHYSIHKMSSLLGIGESNLIEIKTDTVGCMIPEDLEAQVVKQISFGNVPIAVVATLGTTVRGAFDPINSISKICKKYNMWLHADAAWGGGIIFSKIHRSKLSAIEKTDSIVINPHKLISVPQQCSILLVKNKNILKECHSKEAQYLFQKDKFYNAKYDCGDKYLQCGRRCDVFKFWMMWKAKGSSGFEKHVDSILETSKYLAEVIRARNDFKIVSEPQFVNVCFWYIPPSLLHQQMNEEYTRKLHKVAPLLKEKLTKKGLMMINYQPLKDFPNFFRFVSQNSSFSKQDVECMLNYIVECGVTL